MSFQIMETSQNIQPPDMYIITNFMNPESKTMDKFGTSDLFTRRHLADVTFIKVCIFHGILFLKYLFLPFIPIYICNC